MGFNLDDYEPVEDRLDKFWKEHPNGRIRTALLTSPGAGEWIVYAEIWREITDEVPASTGLAHEVTGSTPVNRTSALENCETSALGRALANMGYAAKGKRASREEMAKVADRQLEREANKQMDMEVDGVKLADKPRMIAMRKEIREKDPQGNGYDKELLPNLAIEELEEVYQKVVGAK